MRGTKTGLFLFFFPPYSLSGLLICLTTVGSIIISQGHGSATALPGLLVLQQEFTAKEETEAEEKDLWSVCLWIRMVCSFPYSVASAQSSSG